MLEPVSQHSTAVLNCNCIDTVTTPHNNARSIFANSHADACAYTIVLTCIRAYRTAITPYLQCAICKHWQYIRGTTIFPYPLRSQFETSTLAHLATRHSQMRYSNCLLGHVRITILMSFIHRLLPLLMSEDLQILHQPLALVIVR